VTAAQIPLAELARISPYFALQDRGCAAGEAGFEPVASLIADTPQAAMRLGGRIDDVAARLGTTQRWIGASILFQGWAARLTSIYAGSALLAGLVPDLSVARLYYRAPPSGPVDLLAVPLVATDLGAGWQALSGHLDLFAAAIRRQVRIGQHLLLGNLASALAGSLATLDRGGHAPLGTLIGYGWAQPAGLRRYGQWRLLPGGPRYARTTCCGYTRLPGGGRCGDCSLNWRQASGEPDLRKHW
jgi:iron complex transport system ATP-binding protein